MDGSGPVARDWIVSPLRPAGAPQLSPGPCCCRSPGRARDSPPGGRSTTHPQLLAPQLPVPIQWWRGGRPLETSSNPGGPPAGAPAPACSIAAVTSSDHQPGRGVTQSPGAGPGASGLSTRRGTPMPAGCPPGPLRFSRTRTSTDTPLPRGRRALPYPGLSLPRPTRTGPTTVTLNGALSSPRDHGANSRTSTTERPARGRAGTRVSSSDPRVGHPGGFQVLRLAGPHVTRADFVPVGTSPSPTRPAPGSPHSRTD